MSTVYDTGMKKHNNKKALAVERIELVNLVDTNGARVGTMEKIAAHRVGALHEAFSIFIVNGRGEMMLQKRAKSKYHSGGLWSNACCGHPRPDEPVFVAAHRRLREEMGFDCELHEVFSLTYKTVFKNNLHEYEFDHVFLGLYDDEPRVDQKEASSWRYETMSRIHRDLQSLPHAYTFWFKLIFPRIESIIESGRSL